VAFRTRGDAWPPATSFSIQPILPETLLAIADKVIK
jgi:hypothetical protein